MIFETLVPDFAVEKTSGSTAAVTKHDGDQFSTFLVVRVLRADKFVVFAF